MAYVPPHRRRQEEQQQQQGKDIRTTQEEPRRDRRHQEPRLRDKAIPRRREPQAEKMGRYEVEERREDPSPENCRRRYVSAYESQREGPFSTTQPDESQDPLAQYASLVTFSRYRREQLGQRRGPKEASRRQSAPRAFGTNDHGRGLEPDEDLPEGKRVDAEGMVYELRDGSCVYFCDRFRRYKFFCGAGGLALLRGLVGVNDKLLEVNATRFSSDPAEAAAQRAEGYALYEEKPNLRRRGAEIGTWSNREYALPGFQYFYLRLKSFQRFCESWALLERCAESGLFRSALAAPARVCSLGGGPGYELLAFDWFSRYWSAVGDCDAANKGHFLAATGWSPEPASGSKYSFASLDLQPSWDAYVGLMGYEFREWDVHASDAAAVAGDGRLPVVCILSNILCYCSDERAADFLAALLADGPVRAIIANERGAEQRMCSLLERRGIVVVRLLDQTLAGRDDRQLVFLPPAAATPDLRNIPLPDDAWRVFPNQPYEERKGVRRTTRNA